MSAPRGHFLLLAAIFLVVASLLLWVRAMRLPLLKGSTGYVLADPDSYQRWRLVERALSGESVRIRWMDEDNAPDGRLNEWTSPMTIIGVGMTRLLQVVGGLPLERALALSGLYVGPLLGLLALGTVAWLGWRAGGLMLASLWLFAWPALPEIARVTQFGHADHHGLHQWLYLAALGLCLARGDCPPLWTGALLGGTGALGLWSAGSEFLPAWLTVAALAVWEVVFLQPGEIIARNWRAWWVTGSASLTLAWGFEFWPHLFHGHLEFLSVWHVASWALVGALLEVTCRWTAVRAHKRLAVAVTALAVLVVAGATRGFDWAHLHVMQDKRFQFQMVMTREFESFWRFGMAAGLSRWGWHYGALPLLLVWQARQWRRLDHVARWACLCVAGWLLLSLDQARWESFFVVAVVLTMGWLFSRHPPKPVWLPPWLMLAATIPCWMFVARVRTEVRAIGGDALRGPQATTIILKSVSDCLGAGLAAFVVPPFPPQADPPTAEGGICAEPRHRMSGATNLLFKTRSQREKLTVLAPWDQSGVLAGMGRVRVIGTGYWSNLDGLFTGYEMLATTSRERFWKTVAERHIDLLLVRGDGELAGDIADALIMLHQRRPTVQDVEATAVWQLAHDPKLPELTCPEFKRLAPTWKILQLQYP